MEETLKIIKWRFPGNGYTQDQGLDTSDMETFKKDPMASLARELCQNSIDAKQDGSNKPVRIEFKSFLIPKSSILGRDDIEKQIHACKDTWQAHAKIKKQLESMENQVTQDNIMCLRISDFNTKGLVGVTGGENTPWHYMVHGSGLSNKSATSGGSKGIGKFATFVTSHFNTVFYSTNTITGEQGFEGICKLCSAKQEGTTEKTQGIGYYGSSIQNESINGQYSFDPNFSRATTEYGTDIFILGFKNPTNWKEAIIAKILESFMSAIVYETLEVVVDGTLISKTTLKDIVYDESLIETKIRKSVISQYLLLTDTENRFEDVIDMGGLGTAKLFLMEFDGEQEKLATNGCVMIRYPYMKIRDIEKISTLPCSAMCIIENNDLNTLLRNIENPQHTNWEFNRIEDDSERKELKAIYSELLDNIRRIITDHLSNSDDMQTDVEGAGDYIPGVEGENPKKKDKENKKILDTPTISTKKVKPTNTNVNASVPDENGDGISLDVGSEGDDEETIAPEGQNGGSGGPVKPGSNPSTATTGDDGHILVKHAELRGMSYRFVCLNKSERKYGIIFTSDFDEPDATIELYALDDSAGKTPVEIESCILNGSSVPVESKTKVRFSLVHGQKMIFELTTDQTELFSGEVKVYAYR